MAFLNTFLSLPTREGSMAMLCCCRAEGPELLVLRMRLWMGLSMLARMGLELLVLLAAVEIGAGAGRPLDGIQ